MKYKLIACINLNNSLGENNDLLYHIKDDLKHFKNVTDSSVVIMGRKTYESLPKKPLPNRENIIITSNKDCSYDNCHVVHSIEECNALCDDKFKNLTCFVIGGGSIYNQFMELDLVDTLYLTIVLDKKDGNVKFPSYDEEQWETVDISEIKFDEENNVHYQYLTLIKKIYL